MATETAPSVADFASGVTHLTPKNARLYEGMRSALHCVVEEQTVYRGVFAVRLFPIRHPDHFISLNYTDEADKVREIGVIEDLEEFPEETQQLIREKLSKHYYENA